MQQIKQQHDKVIVSIFVNPIQFGPLEDLVSYPLGLKREILADQKRGQFTMLPNSGRTLRSVFCSYVDVNGRTEALCGKRRPGHFKAVCTIITKLFDITQLDRAYLRQKDPQQLAAIKQMVNDLNF